MTATTAAPSLALGLAPEAEARRAVDEANAAFALALAAGDADAVAAVYAEDARLLAPDTAAIVGRAAIREYWAAGIASGIRGVRLDTIELSAVEGGAIEIGAFDLELDGVEGRVHLVGKYVVLHRLAADGASRWALDIFNADGAPR